MDDIVWYSRFAVLVGALVLLVQSVAGRSTGTVTLIAILLLCIGFVVFVVALALQGLGWPRRRVAAEPVEATQDLVAENEVSAPPGESGPELTDAVGSTESGENAGE